MWLSSPSVPSQRQSQTAVGIGLIVLTLLTTYAVSQAFRQIQADNGAANLARRDAKIEHRQLQGAPWGLPWGIFGGGQSASPANPAQPAITTALSAAAPVASNNQLQGPLGGMGQIVPTVIAPPLTAAVGGVLAPAASAVNLGNALSTIMNLAPSLLQPGGLPSLPTVATNGQGNQSPSSGGLLPPVQSVANSIVGAGSNPGSLLPLPSISGLLNPLTSRVGGLLPVSQATEAVGNAVPVIINVPAQTSAISVVNIIPSVVNGVPFITAAPGNVLSSLIPSVFPGSLLNPLISNPNGAPEPVSVVLSLSSTLPVDFGGLNAPQLPGDLAGAVTRLISSLIDAAGEATGPASAVGGFVSRTSAPLILAGNVPCTMVNIANGTPSFVVTTCPVGTSLAAPQIVVSSASRPVAAPAWPASVSSVRSPVSVGTPASSLQPTSGGAGNILMTSRATPFTTPENQPAATLRPSSAAASLSGGVNDSSLVIASSSKAGAGSQGNNGQPLGTSSGGQHQPSAQGSNAASIPAQAIPPPADNTYVPSQPDDGASATTPLAPVVGPQTTVTITVGSPPSNPSAAPPKGGNGQTPSPISQSGGSIFGVGGGQGSSADGGVQPATPVIPISDCPAVVNCPACPGPQVKPPSGSCPCPGRGYSCSECLNGWFCPPQETPMQTAPCGMGWPCYHCKGGWYCAPDDNKMVPAGVNNPTVVVITTVTAFVVHQPTGASNGTPGDDGNGNGSSNGGPSNGTDDGSGNGFPTGPATGLGPATGPGNGAGEIGDGKNGDSAGNAGPANVSSGNAASTPCTAASDGQPTTAPDDGSGNSNGNGAPNGQGNGQGTPGSGNPSSGYGNPPANPANGNPTNGSGSGTGPGPGSGAPSGDGAPGNTGPSAPATDSNGGSGSGNPNAGSGDGPLSSSAPKAAPEVSDWTHLGCFRDSPIRTLDCDPSNYFAGSMSNEKCIAHCASKGFRLSGTEYGKECWCGNAFQLAERIPEEQCNEVCDGRPTDICGGDWAVTVYSASGQALSVPSDDDNGKGAGSGSGSPGDTGNTGGSGNPHSPPATPLQTPAQGQPSPSPPTLPQPPPPSQVDVAALIQSIINSLPKGSPGGGYGSGLGARDSGASDNNGPAAAPGNAGIHSGAAGGAPTTEPATQTDGLTGYGSQKRDAAGRSTKRSSIIGRRAVAKFDGVRCEDEADEHGSDCVVAKA